MAGTSASEKEWQPGDELTAEQAGDFEIERHKPQQKKIPIWRRVRVHPSYNFC